MLDRRTLMTSALASSLAPWSAAAATGGAWSGPAVYLPQYLQLHAPAATADQRASTLGALYAMLGLEAEAFRLMNAPDGMPPIPQGRRDAWRAELRAASAEDALAAIARAARGRRIVVLNEAHHVARSRAFAIEVAQVLRREGFTHFAAEGFTNDDAGRPMSLSAVTPGTGYYLKDPVFAQLAREVRDGWAGAFAYEAPFESMADPQAQIARREELQAEALAALLRRDPQMRLFVYCGYDHAAKVPPRAIPWMAARLWAKTGIEPLSITQSQGAPAPDPALSWPGVEDVLAAFRPTTSIALKDAQGRAATFVPMPGAYDLAVYHPRLPDRAGRPGWLTRIEGLRRTSVEVPSGPGPRLVQAVPSAELALAANAIPADQVLVEDDRRSVDLWLPPGAYALVVETPAGRGRVRALTV